MSDDKVNERTIEDLLALETDKLVIFDKTVLGSLLAEAITRQDAILAKVPKKRDTGQKVDLRSGTGRKSARDERDKMQFIPPEFSDMFAKTQELLEKAKKKGVG